jgi:hypothetical protein
MGAIHDDPNMVVPTPGDDHLLHRQKEPLPHRALQMARYRLRVLYSLEVRHAAPVRIDQLDSDLIPLVLLWARKLDLAPELPRHPCREPAGEEGIDPHCSPAKRLDACAATLAMVALG